MGDGAADISSVWLPWTGTSSFFFALIPLSTLRRVDQLSIMTSPANTKTHTKTHTDMKKPTPRVHDSRQQATTSKTRNPLVSKGKRDYNRVR